MDESKSSFSPNINLKPHQMLNKMPKGTKPSFSLHINFDSGGQILILELEVLAVVKLDQLFFGRNWPKKDNLLLLHLYA